MRKQDGVEKIIFVSRDGEIYKKCYDKYFTGNTEYIYWSRLVATRLSMEQDKCIFFDNVLNVNKNLLLIEEVLGLLNCRHLAVKLRPYKLSEKELITNSNIEILKEFINDNWNEIKDNCKKECEIAIEYLRKKIGNAKKIALIDVGWKGANLLSIEWFLKEKCNLDIEVKCYMAGITTDKNLSYCLTDKFKGYLFSSLTNMDLQRKHVKANKGFNSMFFEMLSQAAYPSVAGFEVDEKGLRIAFSLAEPENRDMLLEIQKGIVEFVDDYFEHMGAFSYLLNISGRDAYQPFTYFMNNPEFMIRYLGDYRFCRELSSSKEKRNQSVSQRMLQKYKEVKK